MTKKRLILFLSLTFGLTWAIFGLWAGMGGSYLDTDRRGGDAVPDSWDAAYQMGNEGRLCTAWIGFHDAGNQYEAEEVVVLSVSTAASLGIL